MTPKPVIPRAKARRDAGEAVDFYRAEAGEAAALGFIDALEAGFRQIARHPGLGSLRYAYELDLPGLRVWRLRRYPFLVFYVPNEDHIDVWRILHARRDIPAWLTV